MLYFIRHAQSTHNQADKKFKKQHNNKWIQNSQQYSNLKFDLIYLDCGLTQLGKQQCLNAKKQIQQLDVQLVLVSPMRRTLQTCNILFKQHPNKPKILVDPTVRQIFRSSCDIGTRLRQSMIDFPYFDYSLIKNVEYWYIDSIKNQQIKKQLMAQLHAYLQKYKIQQQNQEVRNKIINRLAYQVMLNYLKQANQTLNQYTLSNFQAQKQRMRDLTKQYKKIAIVSHHDNIIIYTKRPSKNCQVLKIQVENL